jgi:hypothetical protein
MHVMHLYSIHSFTVETGTFLLASNKRLRICVDERPHGSCLPFH